MKRAVLNFIVFIAVTVLFSVTESRGQALTGTKTIGGTSPDYATFTAAISDLNSKGVGTGGVTFVVRDGTYTEAITLRDVTGASASNMITFVSQSMDSTKVTLTNSSTTATVQFTPSAGNVQYYRFKWIKIVNTSTGIGNAVRFNPNSTYGTNYIKIENCILQRATTTTSGANYGVVSIGATVSSSGKFQGNAFKYNVVNNGYSGFIYIIRALLHTMHPMIH
ncbi:MAG TPA: hypothetical protein P5050_00010 [Bacteroidia bacterium]|nr:hypothetical protein [Bacteroidia bacterium]HRS57582.1 hypothetical protein [Bacteroidia bacterium]